MKVVFHFDNPEHVHVLMANIKNILKEDDTVEVSVVANSHGVSNFVDDKFGLTKPIVLDDRVNYYVCNNAMRTRDISEDMLISGVTVVSSGVYKLATLQEDGYHYIKS